MAPSSTSAADLAHMQEVKLQRLQGGYTSIYFASVIAAIVLFFACAHWLHRLHCRLELWNTRFGKNVSTWSTPLKKSLYGSKIYGIDVSPERVALAIIYFGVNIGVSVWDIDWHHYTIFANRLGWVSLCNMCLAIFLALKNTPLSPIAGRSYENINVLHRWCGYTTILLMTVHTAVYAAGLFVTDYAHLLVTPGTIAADVAGIAMILIVLTANSFVRRRHYEFFYIAHTILVIVSLIAVCYHTSKAARHSLYMALIATSIYTLDRALRLSRILYYVPTNTATLTPLVSSNATRVTLTCSMARSAPGSHAFLYMPGIRACQIHPFTMLGRDPVEFVISARNGFTKDLFRTACEKPGRTVRAGLEGAYGCVPNITRYDRVVLFAGGSGATFTFALAVDWAKKQDVESKKSLDFIWSVRTAAQLAGFVPELAILKAHPRVNIRVHMTKMSESQAEKLATQAAVDDEPQLPNPKIEAVKPTSITDADDATLPPYAVPGRPDVQSTVRRIASECETNQCVIVAACGPTGLSDNVKDAVRDCTSIDGPSLELHLEAFGW